MLSLYNREEGQGLVEYGLIIFLVAIVIIAILVLQPEGLIVSARKLRRKSDEVAALSEGAPS